MLSEQVNNVIWIKNKTRICVYRLHSHYILVFLAFLFRTLKIIVYIACKVSTANLAVASISVVNNVTTIWSYKLKVVIAPK